MFWSNEVSNQVLRENTQTQKMEQNIKVRRWRYIGHVLRKGNDEDQKVALIWTPEGKRKLGRPREA